MSNLFPLLKYSAIFMQITSESCKPPDLWTWFVCGLFESTQEAALVPPGSIGFFRVIRLYAEGELCGYF